jgi:hypothetical protein
MEQQLEKEVIRVEKILAKTTYKKTRKYLIEQIEQAKNALANNNFREIVSLYTELITIR